MSTPKDNDTQAITDFNEALRKVTYLEHVNAKGVNDDDSAQADSAPQGAALAAGGNSSEGARATAESTTLLSLMPIADLLDHAERGIGLAELASDALLTAGDGMAMLGHCHHALFCQRVDTVEHAQRRDAFHERLHALRQRVSEAKQVEEAPRLQAEAQRRAAMAASVSAGPQSIGGVVDAAVKAMREEWRADVTHTNNIVQSLVIEMGQLRGRSMRLVERIAALEAAQKQARFDAQVQSARIDVWGSSTMRMLLKESDVTHITSEAEMVEAFGEGRGQAMWAECEARKSGGAK